MAANGQSSGARDAAGAALACVETLHSGLIRLATTAASAEPEQRYADVRPLIVATHDLRYIAEFTVRRHWERFDVDEREVFIEGFERLSVTTYASRFVAVEQGSFEIAESRQLASGRAQVLTAISRADGSIVSLEYTLHEVEDGWKIINVIADGVSDLALRRAEYQRILGDGTVADLLAELDAQIAAL